MSDDKYTRFHRSRMGVHLYPTEFLVRTMLGTYPHLQMSREYEGKALLDLGFGDGRNFLLFDNLGLQIFGVEPDASVCSMVANRAEKMGINCALSVGENGSIPFADASFDYLVASHSIYYVRQGDTFEGNACEAARVVKRGGWAVMTFPDRDNSVLEKAEQLPQSHWRITADPFSLRNGAIFWVPADEQEIAVTLAPWFGTFSFARFYDDWFGLRVTGYVVVAQRL